MFEGELKNRVEQQSGREFANRLVLLFASGSYLHGARTPNSDLDIAGVYVGVPEEELAIGDTPVLKKEAKVVLSTSGNQSKNSKEDTDISLYSLRRWAYLALKGNPAVISYLFVPDAIKDSHVTHPSVWDRYILPNRSLFLASGHTAAFLGLGESQYKRMLGLQGAGKHGQRDEEVNDYGYGVKAAMHLIRSMDECLELLNTGVVSFPRPNKDVLLDIRNGKWGLERVKSEYLRLREAVQAAEKDSPLPPKCDREAVNKLVVEAMLYHWNKEGHL